MVLEEVAGVWARFVEFSKRNTADHIQSHAISTFVKSALIAKSQ